MHPPKQVANRIADYQSIEIIRFQLVTLMGGDWFRRKMAQ